MKEYLYLVCCFLLLPPSQSMSLYSLSDLGLTSSIGRMFRGIYRLLVHVSLCQSLTLNAIVSARSLENSRWLITCHCLFRPLSALSLALEATSYTAHLQSSDELRIPPHTPSQRGNGRYYKDWVPRAAYLHLAGYQPRIGCLANRIK